MKKITVRKPGSVRPTSVACARVRNLPEAYRLVSVGLERLDRESPPDRHRLHRSVLLHNRARVLVGLGRLDEALVDFTAAIAAGPDHPMCYLERGNLLRQFGRDEEALADYETAILLGPPFPESQYNRADVLLAAGDIEGGLAALSYVIDLDPIFIDAYVNRAGLYVELGDCDAAAADATVGLALEPDNAHLHSVRGQVHAAKGESDEALAAFDLALIQDGGLQSAWACRAAAAFDVGRLDVAVADLTTALGFGDDAALRFNRATAYRAIDRRADAVADLRRALELDPDDPDTADLLFELSAAG